MDIGTELRRARDKRGLTLDQLAERTKVSAATLSAIETGDLSRLPGGIFTRGFVQAYAREVGLDPAATARRFLEETEPTAAAQTQREAVQARRAEPDHTEAHPAVPQWLTVERVAISGFVLILVYVGFSHRQSPTTPSLPPPPAVATAATSTGATGQAGLETTEIATSGASDPAVTTVPTDGGLHLDIHPQGPCWITATADGARVLYQMADSGERYPIEARNEVVLRLGDAAACTFSINGAEARPLGASSQIVDLTITPDNSRDFVTQ